MQRTHRIEFHTKDRWEFLVANAAAHAHTDTDRETHTHRVGTYTPAQFWCQSCSTHAQSEPPSTHRTGSSETQQVLVSQSNPTDSISTNAQVLAQGERARASEYTIEQYCIAQAKHARGHSIAEQGTARHIIEVAAQYMHSMVAATAQQT